MPAPTSRVPSTLPALLVPFARGGDGGQEVYVMSADGSGVVRVTSVAALDNEPAWRRRP